MGLPLNVIAPDEVALPPVSGFETPDPTLLGVVISHPHQDHYGLAYRLPPHTVFLVGKAAKSILAAAAIFTPGGITFENVVFLEDLKSITLGPFIVTPFLVDHSAYDAYAVLIEADGKRIFYSGDFRAHGRKRQLIESLIRDPPERVGVLLMEGTTIGRVAQDVPAESDLEERFVELFRQTTGMPLVWCSGQNIDRLVTIVRACIKTGRQFIVDFIRQKQFRLAEGYRASRIFPEQLAKAGPHSVMLFRPSRARDVETAACLSGARLICSVWSGYLKDPQSKPFLDWLTDHQIPLDHCHTSGHAAVKDLQRLRRAFANSPVVPIHTSSAEFGNVQRPDDGEWWTVR